MTAFDTDVLTEILPGNVAYGQRASTIPANEQAVPSIVVEEILRGRLHLIRQAEAGKSKISVVQAYQPIRDQAVEHWRNLARHVPPSFRVRMGGDETVPENRAPRRGACGAAQSHFSAPQT